MARHKEAAVEHHSAVEAYTKTPTDYRKNEVGRAKQNWTSLMKKLKS
jgi:hypothetical protein